MAEQERQKAQSERKRISVPHPCGGLTVRRAPGNSSVRTDSTQRRELVGGAFPRELLATLNPEHCLPLLSLLGGMKKGREERTRGSSDSQSGEKLTHAAGTRPRDCEVHRVSSLIGARDCPWKS